MQKFKTQFNAEPSKGEVNTQASQTIPDQSMSVKEIMRRYASGLPIDGQRVPIYEGEELDMPNFEAMDLAEREQYKREVEAELEEINARIKSYDEQKAKAAKEAAKAAENAKKQHITEAEIIEPEPEPKKQAKK